MFNNPLSIVDPTGMDGDSSSTRKEEDRKFDEEMDQKYSWGDEGEGFYLFAKNLRRNFDRSVELTFREEENDNSGGFWANLANTFLAGIGLKDLAGELTKRQAWEAVCNDLGLDPKAKPDEVKMVEYTENGKPIIDKKTGKPQTFAQFGFIKPDGSIVYIQDHGKGHFVGQKGEQGPHFNARSDEKVRNSKVPGTKSHYPYKKGKRG